MKKTTLLKWTIYAVAVVCAIVAFIPVVIVIAARLTDKLFSKIVDAIASNKLSKYLNAKYTELRISEEDRKADEAE